MRTFRVVTSQHKPYYDLIGRDCIETFLKYWPEEVSIELWAENFVPDIENPRLIVKDWNKINPRFDDFVSLIESKTTDPKILGRKKFWMKGHVVLSAMEECTEDVFIWLDSDVVTHKNISMKYLNQLIPENYLAVDIPAGGKGRGKEAETGFFGLNMRHPLADKVIKYYKMCHTTDEMLRVNRNLETAVWWNAVEKMRKKGTPVNDLVTSKDHLMPFMYTELSEYMRHWVAPSNKNSYSRGNRTKTSEEFIE
jgi:hypothetical protein